MPPMHHAGLPWLDERLRRWVDAGIITDDQADAIARLEAGRPTGRRAGWGGGAPAARPPLVAESLAYLGIVLVTASGAFVVARFWDDLLVGGRLGVGALVAILGLGSGTVVSGGAEPGARRLGSFLSLCGTGGVGVVAGVAAAALSGDDAGSIALGVGLAVLTASLVLWRNRDLPLPFLSSLGGAVAAVAGLQDVVQLHPTPAEVGWAVWGAGVGLGALGWWRVVHPSPVAEVVGTLGSFGGAMTVADSHQAIGVAAGLTTAVVAVGAGVASRQFSLAGVGVAGFLVFLARTLAIYVRGTVSAITVLLIGVVLVAIAIGRWRRHGGDHPPPPASGSTDPRWRI